MARLLVRLLPAGPAPADPAKPLYLDAAALQNPAVALANAAREALRMADIVEKMLAGTQQTLHGDDRHLVAETSRMDDIVDRLHEALQRYIAAIARGELERCRRAPADRGAEPSPSTSSISATSSTRTSPSSPPSACG